MDSAEYCDFETFQPNVLYYAEERDGKPTHLLADLFFRTEDNEFVLIDITGTSSSAVVTRKKAKLTQWISNNQSKNPKWKLYGVVLAPFVSGKSSYKKDVAVVRDDYARSLLVGLEQIARWLQTD
jgi:hypothetical protein